MPRASDPRRTLPARFTLPAYLAALFWVVFAPADDALRVTGVVAWIADLLGIFGVAFDSAYVTLEFLANIALFVPFGVLVRLTFTRPPWWAIIAFGFTASVAIELIQLALPTRFSTVSDVIANTAGTAAGVFMLAALESRRGRRCQTARG